MAVTGNVQTRCPDCCKQSVNASPSPSPSASPAPADQFCAAKPAAPIPAPFTLVNVDDSYRNNFVPLTEATGEALLKQFGEQAPPPCPRGRACTYLHDYGKHTDVAEYHGDIEEKPCAGDGFKTYLVKNVYLKGPPADRYTLKRVKDGSLNMWRPFSDPAANAQRLALWNYLRKKRTLATATEMLRRLDLAKGETLWHETQHSIHEREFLKAWANIRNNPKYPSTLQVRCGDTTDPLSLLAAEIKSSTSQRIAALTAKHYKCTRDDFHAYSTGVNTYYYALGECAYWGKNCIVPWTNPPQRVPLPPFPADFTCNYAEGAAAVGSSTTSTNSLQAEAAELDRTLSLQPYSSGNDYYNWGGAEEKWMTASNGSEYFILPSGEFYKWNGSPAGNLVDGSPASTYITTLDGSYHADPSLLYNAYSQ